MSFTLVPRMNESPRPSTPQLPSPQVYVTHISSSERTGKIAGFSVESGKYPANRGIQHEVYGVHLTDKGAKDFLVNGASDDHILQTVERELLGYDPGFLFEKKSQALKRWEHAIPMSSMGRCD